MKNLSNSKRYQDAKAYTESMKLPTGIYKLHVLGVKYIDNSDKGWSDQLVISFDISEGEYAGFYNQQYKANTNEDKKWKGNYRLYVPKDDGSEQDEWTMRRFKTVMNAFEDSNPGYSWNWDENTLKGKYIGGIFNDKEYEINGRTGFFTNCYALISLDQMATAKVPEPTYLKDRSGSAPQPTPSSVGDGFMDIPDGIDEELPFN